MRHKIEFITFAALTENIWEPCALNIIKKLVTSLSHPLTVLQHMQLYTRIQRGLNIARLNETSESVPSGHGNHRNKAVMATLRFAITLVLLAQVHKLHAYTHTYTFPHKHV